MLIDSLQKRGADGDYQQRELSEVMDVRPSLERLCMTVKQYVPGRKGIVYAVSIPHAEHIAEYYRENGIRAVAVSSKTPRAERKCLIDKFKSTSLDDQDCLQVLVSVDLFSEGFDCPDVEFIQLARPTLSLAKYMQMVGRGLRVAEGKECCVILDNVGLYRRFGLPSADRDWQSLFEGSTLLDNILQEACMRVNGRNCRIDVPMNDDCAMMKIIGHECQQRMAAPLCHYDIVKNGEGLAGIQDEEGCTIVECQYQEIEMTNDGFAHCYPRRADGQGEWIDVRNGLRFARRPQSVSLMGIDFCTMDGRKLYPRIRSKFIDEEASLSVKTLELQVGTGLSWKRRFIPWDEPYKVYRYVDGKGNSRLYVDEEGGCYIQANMGSPLLQAESMDELPLVAQADKEEREKSVSQLRSSYKHYEYYPVNDTCPARQFLGNAKDRVRVEDDGIWHVEDHLFHETYWVDPVTHRKHYARPVLFKRGFVDVLREGGWCYVRNIPALRYRPLRSWEIVADDNICVINNEFLFVKDAPRQCFRVCRRTDDFSYFIVKEDGGQEIQITQFEGEGLKITRSGAPPYSLSTSRSGQRI